MTVFDFFEVSPVSRLLSLLGRALIGSPETLGIAADKSAAAGFYYMPGERPIPRDTAPEVISRAITLNIFRRRLFDRVGVAATLSSIVLTIAGAVALATIGGVHRFVASVVSPMSCESLAAEGRAMKQLTADQVSWYRTNCRTGAAQ